jgi:hypothetical protein
MYRRHDDGQLERIWFPDGAQNADVVALGNVLKVGLIEGEDNEYTDDVVAAYKKLIELGRFEDGKVPIVPPRHAWGVYDF